MASTWILLLLFASAILLQEWFGVAADPAAVLDCPRVFKNASINTITYTLNSVEITNAGCIVPANVVFEFVSKSQTSTRQLCPHRYPPLSTCSDFTTSDTCGCVRKDGAVYTYKYTFPADDSHAGGGIRISFCLGNSAPFVEKVSPSCNSISFVDVQEDPCEVLVACIILLTVQVILDAGMIFAFCKLNGEKKTGEDLYKASFVKIVVGLLVLALIGAFLVIIFNVVKPVTLSPCVEDEGKVRVAEVERGKTSTFYCRGFQAGDTVGWWFLSNTSQDNAAGTCPPLPNNDPGGCRQGNLLFFTPSRPSATESVMTVDVTQTQAQNLVSQGQLSCRTSTNNDNDACRTDLITPAVVSTCSVRFGRENNVWQTTGRCVITSASSSRGRYHCRWYGKSGSSPKDTDYSPPNGVCEFKEAMPTDDGEYSYSVTVTPGNVSRPASFNGSNEIKRPRAPTITGCSPSQGDYIAENTAVSCTCRTDSVGQPTGRLVWYRAGDTNPLQSGNYGDTSLTVSQTLRRADHNHSFRCDVYWATDVTGGSRAVKVGYKPEKLSLQLNSSSQTEVTVKENSTVVFTCQADGRPVASMRVVRQGGTEVDSGQSPLTLTLTASCTHTDTYLCSASNVIGQADTSGSAKLFVQCEPRLPQTEPTLKLNYRNQAVSDEVDVIAYPALNASFSSFTSLGPDGTDRASDISNIRLTATCLPRSDVLYISTCTITVHSMTSPNAAGFYAVTLSNKEGSRDIKFKVACNAAQRENTRGRSLSSSTIVAIVLGVVLALVLVVNLVVVIWLCRRRWILPCAQNVHPARSKAISERDTTSFDLAVHSESTDMAGPYDVLNTADIGQRSVYSEITPHSAPSSAGVQQQDGSVYYNF